MISMIVLQEFHDNRKVLVNTEQISSMEEADRNTTVVTLKDGKAWRVSEPLSYIVEQLQKVVEQ